LPAAPEDRTDRLAEAVAEAGLDALIVGDLVRPGDSSREAIADLTWLTGFDGTSALAVVGERLRLFVTDFRYVERARLQCPSSFDLVQAEENLIDTVGALLGGQVGFDPRATSVRERARLERAAADGVELLPVEELVDRLRRTKDEREIASIAAAAELGDQVYAELEEAGFGGRTERDVALWI
jgi:Xaa-Pro aminopeptidase